MKVVVSDIIHNNIPAFHEEGLLLYKVLSDTIAKNDEIEVSFEGVEICATQFLHAAIGKLYLSYPSDTIDRLVHINYGGVSNLEEKIKKVKWSALNQAKHDQIISEAIHIS